MFPQHRLGSKIFSVQATPELQKGAGTSSHLTLPLHCTAYFSSVISLGEVSGEVADINMPERMNFAGNSVLSKTPKLVDLGLSPTHTADKLKSIIGPTTRSGGLTDNFDWIASKHHIAEVTEGIVS